MPITLTPAQALARALSPPLPLTRLGNIIKTADKIYTDAADAADRIHTGADFRLAGAKGPVAKIDVREELLRYG